MKFLKRAAAVVVLSLGMVLGGVATSAAIASPAPVVVQVQEVAIAASAPIDVGKVTEVAIDVHAGLTATVPSLADLVQLVVTIGLPLLVGIITRREFQHKALVLLGLAALTGFGTELLNALQTAAAYNITDGLFRAILSFGAAVLLHYGLYKPEGTAAAVQRLGPQ